MSYGPKILRQCSPPPVLHVTCVMCHMSHVPCHLSRVPCHFFVKFGVVELDGEGPVINAATPPGFDCKEKTKAK